MKIGRNEPCPCGSGRKYKQCCMGKKAAMPTLHKWILVALLLVAAAGIVLVVQSLRSDPQSSNQVWSEEHQHWHDVP